MKGMVSIGKKEWNKAEDFNTALFCMDFAIHDERHRINTAVTEKTRFVAYAELHSLLEQLIDALLDSGRFDLIRIEKLQGRIDAVSPMYSEANVLLLRAIHRSIKKDFFRPTNVMDYVSMKIRKDEVLSQAMK